MNLKSYLITPPHITHSYRAHFSRILEFYHPDYAMYRSNDMSFALEFATICQKYNVLSFLNSDGTQNETLASLLVYFDGLHLKGRAFSHITHFSMFCQVGFSAHNPQELQEALCKGASYCTLSPIFSTPNKGAPLGVESLLALDSHIRLKTFALGGINTPYALKHLESIQDLYGFASIRYFLGCM